MSKLYWLSLIMYDESNRKPWLCAMTSPFMSIENAKEEIKFKQEHYNVLSAWVDTFENGTIITAYHICFMDLI